MTDFLSQIAACKKKSYQLVLVGTFGSDTYTLPQDKYRALKDVSPAITAVIEEDEECRVHFKFTSTVPIVEVMDNIVLDTESIIDYLKVIKYLIGLNGTSSVSESKDELLSSIVEDDEFKFTVSDTTIKKVTQFIDNCDIASHLWTFLASKKDYAYNLWERRYWPYSASIAKNKVWKAINDKISKHDYPREITGESDEASEFRLELQVAKSKFNNNFAAYDIPKPTDYPDLSDLLTTIGLLIEISKMDLAIKLYAHVILNPNHAHIIKSAKFWELSRLLFKREVANEENMFLYLLHFPLYILCHEESIVFTKVAEPSRIILTADEASKFIPLKGVHIRRNPYVQVPTGSEMVELTVPFYNRDADRQIVDQKTFDKYFIWATNGAFKGIDFESKHIAASGSVVRACRARIDSQWKDYKNIGEKYYVHPLELKRRALKLSWEQFIETPEFASIPLPDEKTYSSLAEIEENNQRVRDAIATGASKGKYVEEKKAKDTKATKAKTKGKPKKISKKSQRKEELSDDDILTDSGSDINVDDVADEVVDSEDERPVKAIKKTKGVVLSKKAVSKIASVPKPELKIDSDMSSLSDDEPDEVVKTVKATKDKATKDKMGKDKKKPKGKILPVANFDPEEAGVDSSDEEGAMGPGTEYRLTHKGYIEPITPDVADETSEHVASPANSVHEDAVLVESVNRDDEILTYENDFGMLVENTEDVEHANFLAMMARYYPGYESLSNSEFKLICLPPSQLGKYVKPKYNAMADVDLSVHVEVFADFERIAQEVYDEIRANCAPHPVWMQRIPTATASKFRLYGPGLARDIDMFMAKGRTPARLTKAYHFDCVHSWYNNVTTFSFVGCVLSDLTGINRTYKWFSCASEPGAVVMKYVERSCSIPLNINERKVLEEFIKVSEVWKAIFSKYPNMAIWGSVYPNHPLFHADTFASGIKMRCRQRGVVKQFSDFGHYNRTVTWKTDYDKDLSRYNADCTHIRVPDLSIVQAYIKYTS